LVLAPDGGDDLVGIGDCHFWEKHDNQSGSHNLLFGNNISIIQRFLCAPKWDPLSCDQIPLFLKLLAAKGSKRGKSPGMRAGAKIGGVILRTCLIPENAGFWAGLERRLVL
jgi:hypothetical protein